MASTVLTRLKLGGRLVDAKAAGQLFQTRITALTVLLLALAALITVVVVMVAGSSTDSYLHLLTRGWDELTSWLRGLFS
jgi:uncharacterized membrane-anchored protein